ncbi:MAG TPA: peptidoglycan-binding protein [Candidatus Limiplasma sp.]|nr:peptidoglycan-binding protein [Candidatus Limiplasma sp.]HRX08126.1 peptidoglycan-binding protein [Candidatus Limiplasma sp.]
MITGEQVAQKAKSLLLMGTIPYVLGGETLKGMDCQGLVEWTLRELGLQADYRGTNDMWRNLVTVKGSIEDGVARFGKIPLGALVFIVDHDGGEPDIYQDDEGNAWHVYVKVSDDMLVHASASNLMVTTRLFYDASIVNGGPNAYGLIGGVDYGLPEGAQAAAVAAPAVQAWKPRFSRLTFKSGCMGNGVRELQTGLNKLGGTLAVDGRFGPLTEQAVREFQRQQSLEADGVVGPRTWAALVHAVNQAIGGSYDGTDLG